MKLVQKQFLKGSRTFEIDEDTLLVQIKSLFKEEKLSVDIDKLDPHPVEKDGELYFYNRFKGRPVFSLLKNNPDSDTCDRFIEVLKVSIPRDDNQSAGTKIETPESLKAEALKRNVFEEPPEFAEDNNPQEAPFTGVNPDRIASDISMLNTYLEDEALKPFMALVEKLRTEPDNEAAFRELESEFNQLGIKQGAVLTYAPYLKVLLSNSHW